VLLDAVGQCAGETGTVFAAALSTGIFFTGTGDTGTATPSEGVGALYV
jgi:hypothetical protein